jgi:16S rRNA processing protein RimM
MQTPGKEFVTIGRILAPWGRLGMLKVEMATDFPERFNPSSRIYIDKQPLTINDTTWLKGKPAIKLAGVDDPAAAEEFRNKEIQIPLRLVKPLPRGEYYHFQLIGLAVWTTKGELLGNIDRILNTGANDVYIVTGKQQEFLIPAIDDVVKEVDLAQGRLVIEPIEGLL